MDDQSLERLYTALRRIRRAEEIIAEIYPTDKIKSPVHLSIGQEAVAVGVCDALRPTDLVAPTYRGHALYLAHGGNLRAMMAELYGKAAGCARGKGGSMHLIDMANNVMGASAIVGTTIPVAVGAALALERRGEDRLVCTLFGDGATEEGCFYESLNFAALHRLPVLFVCENNGLAIHQPLAKRWATMDLCGRVRAFGVPAARIENSDVFVIRDVATAAVARIRAGEGPQFLECVTHRWREHVGPADDLSAGYRDRSEIRAAMAGDPVAGLAALMAPERLAVVNAAIEAEIADAVAHADASPPPAAEELTAHVFA